MKMPISRNSKTLTKNSKNNESSIFLKLIFNLNICCLDKVLYARKTGEIEEVAGNGAKGDKITVEDAMVS